MASCLSSFFLFLGGGGDIKQRVLWFGKVYVRSLSAFFGYTLLTSCDRFLSVNSHRWALELLMPDINNATFALSFRRPNCGSFLVYQVTQGFHYKSSGLSYPNGWSVHTQFLFITSIGSLAIKTRGMPEGVDVACFCASQELLMQDSKSPFSLKTTNIWIMIYLSLKLV